MWRRALVGACFVTVALAGQSADAAPQRSISLHGTGIDDGRLSTVVDGVHVPSDRVTVLVNGRPVDAAADQLASKTAVLVLDTSSSMSGDRLRSAVQAARDFLAAVPSDVRVGLLSVATSARLQIAPTDDHSRVAEGLTRLRTGGSTAIYDGTARALSLAPTGEIVVISDGGDTTSRTSLPALLALERGSAATVDVVGLQGSADRAAANVQATMAAAGHGRVYRVDSAALAAADRFTQARITAPVPANVLRQKTEVTVTVTGPSGTARESAKLTIPVAAQPAVGPVATPKSANRRWLVAGVGAVGVAAALLLFLALDAPVRIRRRRRMYDTVARYGSAPRVRRTAAISRSALDLAGRVITRRGLDQRLARNLDAAGIPMQPNEWLLVCVSAAVGSGALMALITGNVLIGLLIGLCAAALVPHCVLVIRASRRRKQFTADLPDALTMMSGSLSSGYSLPQAVDSVVRLGQGVVAAEFGRALAQSRLGLPIEDALDTVADRMDAADLRWVVMAIRIQRRVGGNLAEILLQVAETIRERGWLRRHVQGLSAEGRLSATILGLLPVFIGAYMFLVRRAYVRPL
ncbi:MAG TPA: VWA domain-containing protein, partial [Mycobacteriales bacterium]|nr:VWA domain-containing protein [Mycobacteriales bacterium]